MEETLINGKTLAFYLKHLGALKLVERSELLRLAEQYPYSAHLHLLLSVKDHLENTSTNRDLLERAALYISDRRKLGEWMNKLQSLRQDEGYLYGQDHMEALSESLDTLETTEVEQSNDLDQPEIGEIAELPEDEVHDILDDEPELAEDEFWAEKVSIPEKSSPEDEIKVIISNQETIDRSEGTIVETEEDVSLPIEEEVELKEEYALPEVIDEELANEISVETKEEIIEESVPTIDPEEEEEEEEEEENQVDHPDKVEESMLEAPEVVTPAIKEDVAELEIEMRESEEEIIQEEVTEKEVIPRGDRSVTESESQTDSVESDSPFLRWLNRLEASGESGFQDFEEVHKRQKQKPVPVEEISKKDQGKKKKKKIKKKKKKKSWKMDSLQLDESLVSEALADLLASQGHIDRAIEMYEKLRLTIPEKSVFFAQKIKALKQKK